MSAKHALPRRAGLSLAALAVGGATLFGATALSPGTADAAAPVSHAATSTAADIRPAAAITRAQVLERAATWLTANGGSQVPYSQSSVWSDGYRQDCSGYASMALNIWKPGHNTVTLAEQRNLTTPIAMSELEPGDLVIDATGSNTTRHVVIFEKWTDSSKSSYVAYEQRGGHGTDHRTLTYGLEAGSEFAAYRPVNITD
ncbi:hypothetical protein [Streptomyces sp. NPDC048845]|uniref:hypothetical protein n=1 Tax=Streptomyces sp. NPDC048845 TaxID=3155390 RepID=UPI00341D4808